jgi:hypothetical protein
MEMHGIELAVQCRLRTCALRVCLVSLLLTAGCVVSEGNAACGENQVEVNGDGAHYCLCKPGFIIDDDAVGCKACGENEESKRNECVCKEGYVRTDGVCTMSSLGAACDSDAQCAGDFPICVMEDAAGYCSSEGCSTSGDCQPMWFCDRQAEPATCKKPPNGYRQPCEAAADCAGTSATFCDTFQSHSCLIQGCGVGAPCPGDWSCCRIMLLGVSLCIEPSGLAQGACPAGGMLVMP